MKAARFIVDTHVHSQRHAAGAALKGSKDYKDLANAMFNIEAYDNSRLYAAGMDAEGWVSHTYCRHLAGSGLGFALNSGRVAGGKCRQLYA